MQYVNILDLNETNHQSSKDVITFGGDEFSLKPEEIDEFLDRFIGSNDELDDDNIYGIKRGAASSKDREERPKRGIFTKKKKSDSSSESASAESSSDEQKIEADNSSEESNLAELPVIETVSIVVDNPNEADAVDDIVKPNVIIKSKIVNDSSDSDNAESDVEEVVDNVDEVDEVNADEDSDKKDGADEIANAEVNVPLMNMIEPDDSSSDDDELKVDGGAEFDMLNMVVKKYDE